MLEIEELLLQVGRGPMALPNSANWRTPADPQAEQIHTPEVVFHVAEERQPGWASRIRFRLVMNAEDTPNHILVDGNAESQRDLLGDAGTTPGAITPFQFNDCVDEFFIRSFPARRTPALERKQYAVLSFSSKLRDSISKSIPAHVCSIVGLIRIDLQRERSSK
jgi:hypothetical protein